MKHIDEFVKIDLHIHSEASKTKSGDEGLVSGMNKDNIETLLDKLDDNKINVFSITDHNTFDFELYKLIKDTIAQGSYDSIKNILPAVEFDLEFDPEFYEVVEKESEIELSEDKKCTIHVISIFNDNNQDELSKLSENLKELYKKKLNILHQESIEIGVEIAKKNINVVFNENDLSELFKSINVNFLLIAHQKGPYMNRSMKTENDFTNLSYQIKEKLLFIKYFDALEFKQLRSNISLKSYLRGKAINFISGSDCHNWNFYPMNSEKELNTHSKLIQKEDNRRFEYTYLKCDSSFEGLKIALTGDSDSRIYLSEPNVEDRVYLKSLDVKVSGNPINIPLSYGINAIIGNNTSGKTLLINTAFDKFNEHGNGEPFCRKYDFWPSKLNLNEFDYEFIAQGDIVNKFSKDKELEREFDGKFKDIDYSKYDQIIEQASIRLLRKIKYNTDVKNAQNGLDIDIKLPSRKLKPYQLVITTSPAKVVIRNTRVISQIEAVIDKLFLIYPTVKPLFHKVIHEILQLIIPVYRYYTKQKIDDNKSKAMVDAFRQSILDYNNKTRENQSQYSDTNQFLNVNDSKIVIYNNFINLLKLKDVVLSPPIKEGTNYNPKDAVNTEGDFKFIKSSENILNDKTLKEILESPFKANYKYENILQMTVEQAIDALVQNSTDIVNSTSLSERYRALLQRKISSDYRKVKLSIVDSENGLKNQSPGKNAITYLRLKNISNQENIYVIDQPEDQIGPTDIKKKLKSILRKLASKSQIIMITHNPYLVVNLDVDNVIQLDNTSGKMEVSFGALYHKDNGNIIDIVANSLEGGYEAIKERMDRYERNNH
ncbi:hypothetical protein HF295_07600 [Hujiaoplasma nucleasis]|uniref:AAA family ATPase n=1 Tax=Hujiaoplasma nucleasis TaxID=2725268 RepID=A0A7L6N378_9MOLU|nr:hypothetical protein [Hujiaoplasma nucleasis]QLY40720.1 hypothetical protein HF295_07600 [Hujiaoplasma nucleasis]